MENQKMLQTDWLISHLPRYILLYKNTKPYWFSLVIYKYEWEGHDEAYQVFYAQEKDKVFNANNSLYKVVGITLNAALNSMNDTLIAERQRGNIISETEYVGTPPAFLK